MKSNSVSLNLIIKALMFIAYAILLTWADTSAAASTTPRSSNATSANQPGNLDSKLDSLGGNSDLNRRAKYLSPNNRTEIVQKREVDRHWRVEAGIGYGLVGGGDPYINTQAVNANLDLHINPHWSVGARYFDFSNNLSSEGKRVFNDAANSAALGQTYTRPDVDYPKSSTLGVLCFYPLYGKLNMFDLGVAQFDIYVLGGGGQMVLNSGSTSTWTAGGGVGLWLSQHFTTRFEVRYQSYKDQIYSGPRDENTVVSTLSIGFLL